MKYKELQVSTTTEGSDLVAMILLDLGSEGVSIYDSNDVLDMMKNHRLWDYIEPDVLRQSPIVRVKGFYNIENFDEIYRDANAKIEELRLNSPFELGSLEIETRDLDDVDWVNEWKKYYDTIHICDVAVVPKWIKYQPAKDEKVILIDPGMAFGTGSHESTQLCIKLFRELDCVGKTVLDIGSGSGILGMVASVCGASKVVMSDISELAVKVCKENILLNNIKNATVTEADLLESATIKGDIIFANLTADILIELSKNIDKVVKKDSYLVLSGIIHARYNDVLQAFLNKGFILDKSLTLGEWCGLRLKSKINRYDNKIIET